MEPQHSAHPHTCKHCKDFVIFNPIADRGQDSTAWREALRRQEQLRLEVAQSLIRTAKLDNLETDYEEAISGKLSSFSFLKLSNQDLQRFASDGCRLSITIQRVVESGRDRNMLERVMGPVNGSFSHYYEQNANSSVVAFIVERECFSFGHVFLDREEKEGNKDIRARFLFTGDFHYRLFAQEDDPAAAYSSHRPFNIRPSSDESFELITQWLEECRSSHPTCANDGSPFLPTRLIEIEASSGYRAIRLVETSDAASTPYAALSYCWGGEQKLRTTKITLGTHLKRIDFRDLPPTLQHAIDVSEKLGIRYLWVDALCIVQDDDHEKAVEIDRMSYVYSHATITISASRACRVQEGFLQDRLPYTDQDFKLSYLCPDGQIGSVALVLNGMPHEPLSTRAWALQERLLSNRILEFGTLQTQWMCRSTYHADGSDRIANHNDSTGLDLSWDANLEDVVIREKASLEDPHIVSIGDDKELSAFEKWAGVVEQCTLRSLTVAQDRLPSVAGIAERLSHKSHLHDQYLAGLWRSFLPKALLWATHKCNTRPIAPSWSWGSVDGRVSYFKWMSRYNLSETAIVIDAGVQLRDQEAKFGIVDFGLLKIKGPLQPAVLKNPRTVEIPSELCSGDASSLKIRSWLDLGDELPKGDCPVFLLSVTQEEGNPLQSFGLILQSHVDGLYSRVGIFSAGYELAPREEADWLTRASVETITIR